MAERQKGTSRIAQNHVNYHHDKGERVSLEIAEKMIVEAENFGPQLKAVQQSEAEQEKKKKTS